MICTLESDSAGVSIAPSALLFKFQGKAQRQSADALLGLSEAANEIRWADGPLGSVRTGQRELWGSLLRELLLHWP